jgi:DNA-binding NtrC family response regulator
VVVRAGPDTGRGASLHRHQVLSVGRGEGEGLKLADQAVSRHHLSLECSEDGRVRVVEITGVNPVWTIVEGQRRTLSGGELLDPSAALTVGNTTLAFEAEAILPVGEAADLGLSGGLSGMSGMSGMSGTPDVDGRATIEMDARQVGHGRLAALAALGDRLARCGSLQAVYRTASEWAIDALPASRALLLSPDGSDILAAATSGPVVDLAISRTLLHRVLSENRAVLVRDVLAEPELADRRSVQVRGIRGAMAAPSRNLVFYAEQGAEVGPPRGRWDDSALTLLVCAAQLLDALGDSASERSQMRAALSQRGSAEPARIVGNSASVKKLHVFLERVATTNATVLINGESGTGKELAARMVHALSPRANQPFIAINCAAVPENLLESEFFGHEKGAFTGAVGRHEGVFERAHSGTLFLDEIAEMAPATQARMLRVLENRSFTRVGGTEEVSVDVRLIAATHRDLRQLVTDGVFREDLLYRLSVIQTRLPPLRERREDIPELVRHFCDVLGDDMGRHVTRIADDALEVLTNYRWPGNVRELRNVVERALVLGDGSSSAPGSIGSSGLLAMTSGKVLPLAELEHQAINAALEATGGNKARAAALLGIDRTTLYRKLKELQ